MDGQIPMFPAGPPGGAEKGPLQVQFEATHRAAPQVLATLVNEACLLRRVGRAKGGVSLLWERLRWLHLVPTGGPVEGYEFDKRYYRMANAHRAFYARVAMAVEPQLRGFFQLRPQRVPFVPDWEALKVRPAPGWEFWV